MLSLAAIVKNEVQTIEQTIFSVKKYVDEIVVGLDADSNDGTLEILARIKGVKIIPIHLSAELAKKGSVDNHTDWGFSKARNKVLDACNPNSWRLIMDGHEIVRNADKMKEAIQDASDSCDSCDSIESVLHFEPDQFGIDKLIYRQARILAPQVKYRNPIHNAPIIEKTFFSEKFSIEHKKKEQAIESKKARDVQRSDSTINGLKKVVAASPNNARAWFYLGQSYKENGYWNEAIDAFKKYLTISDWNEERWHARANMGACYSRLNDNAAARKQFVLALGEFPAMAEAYYYLGDLAYKQKYYHEAEIWLTKCIELDLPNCRLFINPKIYLIDRYDLLSMVYSHLKQYGRAIDCAKKALKVAPNARIEKNIQFWKKHINDHNNQYYDGIWQKHKPSLLELQRLKAMVEEIESAKHILDVGSGPGYILQYLTNCDYTAVDGSAYARRQVKKKGGHAVSNLKSLKNKKFDACILGEILEHLENDEDFLKEIIEYLADNAVIVASVPRYGAMYDPAHAREYTRKQFENLMKSIGTINKIDLIGPWMICSCKIEKSTEENSKPEAVLEVI